MGARANLLEEPRTAAASVVGIEARPRLTMVRPRPEAPPTAPTTSRAPGWRRCADQGAGGDGARRELARSAAPRRPPRDPAAPRLPAAPARRRPRRPRAPERRRRAGRDPRQARRLPRRQPVHHLGLQVRAARGGGQAAPARLAGPRGADRVRALGRLADRRRFPGRRRREPRDAGRDRRRDAGRALAASARASWSRWRSTGCRSTCSPSGMETTRGALYKTIHDARRKLRASLGEQGLGFDREPDPTEVAR